MEPLTIYVLVFALLALAGGLVQVFRHQITRLCPRCDARVELGRPRCQACGYRFSAARD